MFFIDQMGKSGSTPEVNLQSQLEGMDAVYVSLAEGLVAAGVSTASELSESYNQFLDLEELGRFEAVLVTKLLEAANGKFDMGKSSVMASRQAELIDEVKTQLTGNYENDLALAKKALESYELDLQLEMGDFVDQMRELLGDDEMVA